MIRGSFIWRNTLNAGGGWKCIFCHFSNWNLKMAYLNKYPKKSADWFGIPMVWEAFEIHQVQVEEHVCMYIHIYKNIHDAFQLYVYTFWHTLYIIIGKYTYGYICIYTDIITCNLCTVLVETHVAHLWATTENCVSWPTVGSNHRSVKSTSHVWMMGLILLMSYQQTILNPFVRV